MENLPGIKTSEFLLLAATVVLAQAFGTATMEGAIVSAASIGGAGLYALGRGLAKRKEL